MVRERKSLRKSQARAKEPSVNTRRAHIQKRTEMTEYRFACLES
jgi:hypothetical protein